MSTPLLISYVLLWILVTALAVGVLALYHHFGQMYLTSREGRARHGLPEGTLVKSRIRATIDGRSIQVPTPGRLQLILFTETVCPLCERLQPDIRRLARRVDGVDITVVCVGEPAEVRKWARPLEDAVTIVPDPKGSLAAKYGVGLSPFAIAVGADLRVRGRAIVNDAAGLDWAVERLLTTPVMPALEDTEAVQATTA